MTLSHSPSKTLRYGLAALCVIVALVVRLGLDPIFGTSEELLVLTLAVLAAARFGGRGPGLAATALSVVLACFFFIEPRFSFVIENLRDAGSLVVLAAAGVCISLLGHGRREAPGSETEPHPGVFRASVFRRTGLLGGAFLTLIVLTRLLYADFEREKDRRELVTHTYQVLDEIRSLAALLDDAETGQRGYLLTGDPRYLEPFETAQRTEPSVRASLRRLTADEPAQQASLDTVDRLVEAKVSELRKTVPLRRDESRDAALAVVRTGEGKRIMDECRAALAAVEGEERRLLAKRSAAAEAQTLKTRWVLGLGSCSLLMLLVIAGTVIERDTQARERARQAVQRSEGRLRLALDAADAGTWEWDVRTNRNVWSEELWKLYGLEPHSCEPAYEAWRKVVDPDDLAKAEQVMGEAARTGSELNVEFRVRDRDGGRRWLLARAQPLRDAEGRAARFVGIALDITRRKQAEEALREREQNLRRFTEVAPVAIAMFDRDMRYMAASRRYRDDYHLGATKLLGRTHYEIFPEMPEHWREIHRRCLDGAVESHPGERFLRSDGTEQWIRWEIQPWRRGDDGIGGIVLFSEEITAQKRSEQALRESEARLRLAQQVARVGSFEWNLQTGARTWTPELEAMYGLPPGGYIGTRQAWVDMLHPEDRPAALRHSEQATETGKLEAEWRAVWPDGTVHWLASRAWAFKDEAGKPLRMIGVNIDITEVKRAEETLRRTEAALKEAQRVAHLGSWQWNAETDAVTGSEELYRICGLDPELPFPGFKNQALIFSPGSRARLNSAVETALRTGTGYELDLEIPRADGASVWVAARGEALRDASGNIVGLHGTLQNVTRRKQAEDEILARNSVLDAISRILGEAYSSSETEESLGRACLSIAESLTESRFGFIGEMDSAGRLNPIAAGDSGWDTGRIADLAGIAKGLYTDDPPNAPGFPLHHPPLKAFLAAPLVYSGKTIGLIGLGDREGGYRERDLEALEALAPAIVQAFLRKRAEEARRESESRFRTLANAIPQLCWMAEADGGIFWYNRRWYEYTGTTLEQMAGWGWQSVHNPDTLPQVLRRWEASIATGELFDMVFPLRGADGTFHPFLTRVMPVRDSDGKVVRWFGTNTDITEQHRAEAALRQLSEQRRLAMEAAELGAWEYRFATGDVFWDQRCRMMFGAGSDEQIAYDDAIERIHPEDRAATRKAVNEALAGDTEGGGYHVEFRVVWPDGTVRWIASHGRVRFEDENGQRLPAHFSGVNMDVTERKQAELEIRLLNSQLEQRVRRRTVELETANKELEAFAYSVSHDLRAPLRGIDGWSLALAEDYAGRLDDRAQQYLDRVRSETQRMGLLIDALLQLSRVSRADMQFVPVDLSGIAHRIAEELKEAHPGRGIEFVIAPGISAAGDGRLLEIALTNLLANAVKFTGPRPQARIEFGRTEDRGRPAFYVRDNGVGFDMAYAGALFGAFQRLHKASEFPGTGIGLATVRRVIHRHGGRVWAESQPDRGTAFYFTIGEIV